MSHRNIVVWCDHAFSQGFATYLNQNILVSPTNPTVQCHFHITRYVPATKIDSIIPDISINDAKNMNQSESGVNKTLTDVSNSIDITNEWSIIANDTYIRQNTCMTLIDQLNCSSLTCFTHPLLIKFITSVSNWSQNNNINRNTNDNDTNNMVESGMSKDISHSSITTQQYNQNTTQQDTNQQHTTNITSVLDDINDNNITNPHEKAKKNKNETILNPFTTYSGILNGLSPPLLNNSILNTRILSDVSSLMDNMMTGYNKGPILLISPIYQVPLEYIKPAEMVYNDDLSDDDGDDDGGVICYDDVDEKENNEDVLDNLKEKKSNSDVKEQSPSKPNHTVGTKTNNPFNKLKAKIKNIALGGLFSQRIHDDVDVSLKSKLKLPNLNKPPTDQSLPHGPSQTQGDNMVKDNDHQGTYFQYILDNINVHFPRINPNLHHQDHSVGFLSHIIHINLISEELFAEALNNIKILIQNHCTERQILEEIMVGNHFRKEQRMLLANRNAHFIFVLYGGYEIDMDNNNNKNKNNNDDDGVIIEEETFTLDDFIENNDDILENNTSTDIITADDAIGVTTNTNKSVQPTPLLKPSPKPLIPSPPQPTTDVLARYNLFQEVTLQLRHKVNNGCFTEIKIPSLNEFDCVNIDDYGVIYRPDQQDDDNNCDISQQQSKLQCKNVNISGSNDIQGVKNVEKDDQNVQNRNLSTRSIIEVEYKQLIEILYAEIIRAEIQHGSVLDELQ